MPERQLRQSLADLACAVSRKVRNCVASNEAARHLLDAEKELLLAVRAMVDGKIRWIESLKQPAAGAGANEQPAQ
jgi:hypothetical protein